MDWPERPSLEDRLSDAGGLGFAAPDPGGPGSRRPAQWARPTNTPMRVKGKSIPSLWRDKHPAIKGLRPPEHYAWARLTLRADAALAWRALALQDCPVALGASRGGEAPPLRGSCPLGSPRGRPRGAPGVPKGAPRGHQKGPPPGSSGAAVRVGRPPPGSSC